MTGHRFLREHATGVTITLLIASAVALSLAPLPDWARPLDVLREGISVEVVARIARGAGGQVAAPVADAPAAAAAAESAAAAVEETPKEEIAPLPPKVRAPWVEPKRERYQRMRTELRAEPLAVVNPCVEQVSAGCTRRALDRFFSALADAADGLPTGIVRVVHFGDSLIASDHITDMVRLRLQERFGSAGRGFLFVDRLSRAGRGVRAGKASDGWKKDTIAQGNLADHYFGYGGLSFTAESDGETSEFELASNRLIEVFYLRHPTGGTLEIAFDDQVARTIETASETPEASVLGLVAPENAKTLKLTAKTKGVRLFGVSLEAENPGVVYESLGLPGANYEVWSIPDEDGFKQQLVHRDPTLLVTMLGGNDGLELYKKARTPEQITAHATALLRRLRVAAPDADCLVIGPMDAAKANVSGEIVSKPQVETIVEISKKVAAAEGCAFWDMWRSMGATGSLSRWYAAGLINGDLIHPKGYGGDLLGELMTTSLMAAYDEYHRAAAALVSTTTEAPPVPLEPALASFFTKLNALERDKAGRVAVAMFGSNYVARHYMTDELRALLSARFGSRGRGYASCGRAAKVLEDAGVRREIKGRFSLLDGTRADKDEITVGMSGIRTDLPRGSRFVFAPCAHCEGQKSTFELFFLKRAGMGSAELSVSGAAKSKIGRSSPSDPEVAAKRITTSGARPVLSVESRGPGPFELLGVAHEIERPGIIVDPIAYPGVTPDVALRWDQDLVLGMLSRRRPDLLILFYGEAEAESSRFDVEAYRASYAKLLKRLKKGAEGAGCLIVAGEGAISKEDDVVKDAPNLEAIRAAQQEVANKEGCAFVSMTSLVPKDARSTMYQGGSGKRRDVSEGGLRKLGQYFAQELLGRYDRWLAARERANPQEAAARTP